MRKATILIGFIFLMAVISGCAEKQAPDKKNIAPKAEDNAPNVIDSEPEISEEINADTSDHPENIATDEEVMKEIDNTFVDDLELDVGEMY